VCPFKGTLVLPLPSSHTMYAEQTTSDIRGSMLFWMHGIRSCHLIWRHLHASAVDNITILSEMGVCVCFLFHISKDDRHLPYIDITWLLQLKLSPFLFQTKGRSPGSLLNHIGACLKCWLSSTTFCWCGILHSFLF
jgi:hypothetical protein